MRRWPKRDVPAFICRALGRFGQDVAIAVAASNSNCKSRLHRDAMNTFSPEQVDGSLSVTAQRHPEDMPALAAAGFRSVINNRPDFEGSPSQPTSAQLEAAARAAGLDYPHRPVPPAGHTPEQARSMARAVDALPQPVLAFCRTGRRSVALYRMGKGAV